MSTCEQRCTKQCSAENKYDEQSSVEFSVLIKSFSWLFQTKRRKKHFPIHFLTILVRYSFSFDFSIRHETCCLIYMLFFYKNQQKLTWWWLFLFEPFSALFVLNLMSKFSLILFLFMDFFPLISLKFKCCFCCLCVSTIKSEKWNDRSLEDILFHGIKLFLFFGKIWGSYYKYVVIKKVYAEI